MADNQEQVLDEVVVQSTKPTTTQINGPYGYERVPVQDLTIDSNAITASSVVPDGQPIQLDSALVQNDLGFSTGEAQRADAANFQESTMLEGVGAAIQTWDTTRLIKRLARPSFANDEPINQFEYLEGTPLSLDEDEREYFLDVGKGKDSAAYAIKQIEDRRQARRVVGDHEIVGLGTAFIDPLWLAVPPALRIGKLGKPVGRLVAGASGAGIAGAAVALGEGPVADEEIALAMMMNGAISTVLYREGKGLVKADPDFPDVELDAAIKPKQPFEGVADEALPDAVATKLNVDYGLGETLQWNMRKTMAGFGPAGKKVSDILFDNNSDFSTTSLESHYQPILANLNTNKIVAEDLLRDAMAKAGAGTLQRAMPWTARKARQIQTSIEKDVQREMFRREQYTRQGLDLTQDAPAPHISAIADALDKVSATALKEMKAAGVEGAENLLETPGWLHRKWDSSAMETVMGKLEGTGLSKVDARRKLTGLVGLSIRRANNMSKELADQIGEAIVDRAMRKGYYEDIEFNSNSSAAELAKLRDVLKGKLSNDDLERALSVLRVESDEAGKAGYLKHRMHLDYKATVRVGNENISIMDLIDGNITSSVDQYTRQVATSSAFARKGLKKRSDIDALRTELLHDIPAGPQRDAAKDLFDNSIAHLRGEPNGAMLNENFRLAQSYGTVDTTGNIVIAVLAALVPSPPTID